MPACRAPSFFEDNGSSNQMPNKVTSVFLSRPSPCDVPQGYASVGGLPAALLDDPVGHLVENLWGLKRGPVAFRSNVRLGSPRCVGEAGARVWEGEKVWPV